MSRRAARLLREEFQLPSLPSVVVRVNEAINNSASAIAEIGEILSEDIGLSSRLLELVNSSVYGLKQPVETVSRAAVIVGTEQIRELVLATTVIDLFDGIPRNLIDVKQFWLHGVACGLAAQRLGRHAGIAQPERFFSAGIFHDVGRLVLFLREPERSHEVFNRCRIKKCLFYEAEREVFGFDHADMGFEVMKLWSMPSLHREAVAFHHDPAGAFRHAREAAVVHVADVIANALQLGFSGEPAVPEFLPEAWELLGVDHDIVPDLVADVSEHFAETTTLV